MNALNALYVALGTALLRWRDRGPPLDVAVGRRGVRTDLFAVGVGVWETLKLLGDGRSRLLSLAGPLMLILTLSMWVGLIWAGWTLIFGGIEGSIAVAHSDLSVTWVGIVYFVAFTMFGMGNGGFYPTSGLPQLITTHTTTSAGLFVAMGVSCVISVLGAVSEKRSFASSVTGVGNDSEGIIQTGWDSNDFEGLRPSLTSLASRLDQLADQHKSYPILHYYHSEQPEQASALAVAILDESMTLLRFGVSEEHQPDVILVENVRTAARNYLDALDEGFVQSADETPPAPDLDRLRAADVPTVSDEAFAAALDELDERRRLLLGVVHADAREWPPIDEHRLAHSGPAPAESTSSGPVSGEPASAESALAESSST